MTPDYLNSPPPPPPPSPPPPFPLQLHEDHQLIFRPKPQPSSSSSTSSLTCPIFFNPAQEQGGCYYRDLNQLPQPQHEVHDQFVYQGGSYDHQRVLENESDNGLKLNMIWKREARNDQNNHHENGSVKWMSSKMRAMQKMMISDDRTGARKLDHSNSTTLNFGDHKQQSLPSETDIDSSINSSNLNSNNTMIRVCADCNTTKTPLWRSGPRGPKSLCNACGIRQRKARRAMAAAAAAAANGTILPTNTTTASNKSKGKHKDKRPSNNGGHVSQYNKKRYKLAATNSSPSCETKKLCFEEFTINLSKNSALHRVFPQDEIKEAAILLMALSCGLVHG